MAVEKFCISCHGTDCTSVVSALESALSDLSCPESQDPDCQNKDQTEYVKYRQKQDQEFLDPEQCQSETPVCLDIFFHRRFFLCFRDCCRLCALSFQACLQICFFHDVVIFRCHFNRNPAETVNVDLCPCVAVFARNLYGIPGFFVSDIFRCDKISFYIAGRDSIVAEHQCRRRCIMNTVSYLCVCQKMFHKVSILRIRI